MKNKKLFFTLIGIASALMIIVSLFFVAQGLIAAQKEQRYFDVYRARAEEYIRSDPEIINKYGNDVSVRFDNSVTYIRSDEGTFDIFLEVFAPQVPDTVEEFAAGLERIRFNVNIDRNEYEIVFEKNAQGELVVSSLSEVEKQ